MDPSENYKHSVGTKGLFVKGQLTNAKLFLLLMIGFALSTVLPMFAAIPLTLSFLFYGPLKTSLAGLGILVVILAAAMSFPVLSFFKEGALFFFGAFGFAWIVQLIVEKNENPADGFIKRGLALFLTIVFIFGLMLALSGKSYTHLIGELVDQQVVYLQNFLNANRAELDGEQLRSMEDLIKAPSEIVTEFVNYSFSAAFFAVILNLWVTLFIVLKNALVWKNFKNYDYEVRDLLKFKAPFPLVFVLVSALILVLVGERVAGQWLEVVGENLLYCLGLIYFFQGMGVFLGSLNFLKVKGFMRAAFCLLAIVYGHKMIALVGIFDNWFDFSRMLEKKNEGDIL